MNVYDRVYNFSAGPSVLPLPVLEKVKDEKHEYDVVLLLNVGDNVEFKIYRDRKTITLTMTLDEYVPEKDIVKY